MGPVHRAGASCFTALCLLLCAGVPLGAQTLCPEYGIRGFCRPPPSIPVPEQRADLLRADPILLVLASHLATGALTGGIGAWRNEESFLEGFVKGALGGIGSFAGKWIAASDFSGSGALGRAIASGGASITRNVAAGNDALTHLTFPVGPVRVHWERTSDDLWASLDVVSAAAFVYAFRARGDARWDVRQSLSSSAPVFRTKGIGQWRVAGQHMAGNVILSDTYTDFALLHERVHVLQYDQAYLLWGAPLENWVLRTVRAPDWISRYLDFSGHFLLEGALSTVSDGLQRHYEREAHGLSGTGRR